MKQYRFILGTFIFLFICWASAFITSCSKDDEPIKTISQDVVKKYELKGEEVVLENLRINLETWSRSGITLAPIFFEGSYTLDNYLTQQLGIPFQRMHTTYNHSQIDTILFVRSNPADANIGFLVTNYNITIYYKDGSTDHLPNHLSKVKATDIYKSYTCQYPIYKSGLAIKKTVFCKTLTSPKKYLPYRDQTVSLSEWQIKVFGFGTFRVKPNQDMQPENSLSTQYQPKHTNN